MARNTARPEAFGLCLRPSRRRVRCLRRTPPRRGGSGLRGSGLFGKGQHALPEEPHALRSGAWRRNAYLGQPPQRVLRAFFWAPFDPLAKIHLRRADIPPQDSGSAPMIEVAPP